MTPLSATLLGATGMVGADCLRLLLADERFARVVTVGRRPLPPQPAGERRAQLVERVADMQRLEEQADAFATDRVICALGTTMKQAGSREAFRRVDHDLVLEAARLALASGASHFLLVSALGADAAARVFYNRVKGEVERALLGLPFRAITIVRPSLLVGVRRDARPFESLGRAVAWAIPGRWRPVRASDVARVLVEHAAGERAGALILESEEIRRQARSIRTGGTS